MGSQPDSHEFLTFELPYKHQSGTGLMSNHILLDPVVTGLMIDAVVGPDAKDKYSRWPTEWIDGNKSDVVYIPGSHNDELHPIIIIIIIEVQPSVNKELILGLMSYAISAYREDKKQPPILMIFEVTKRTTRSKSIHCSRNIQVKLGLISVIL